MSKNCIVTVCSADSYQNFIPLFVFSALKACPDADVIVLLTGKVNDVVSRALAKIPQEWEGRWQVLEDMFLDIPATEYSTNCMRFLIPHGILKNYRFAYITDVDFVILPHKISLFRYFIAIMDAEQMPIASFRSAIKRFWRPKIHGKAGWTGKYKRIVAGTTMIDVRAWYKATSAIRDKYMTCALKGKPDGLDKHPFASYREYDEVMLARMCSLSGIRTPEPRRTFVGGAVYNRAYRDIHLGDLKFGARIATRRFSRNVTRPNRKRFLKLWKNTTWVEIVKICSESDRIKQLIATAYKLCKKRKKR